MVNRIVEGNNQLVPVDYSDLLQKILQILQGETVFNLSSDRQRITINFDEVAKKVANISPHSPLLEPEFTVRVASVNFTEEFKKLFPGKVRQIRDFLKDKLTANLSSANQTIAELLTNLTTDLNSYQNSQAKLNFTYPFPNYSGLVKERLSIQKKEQGAGSKSLLKFHKVTITVNNLKNFDTELKEGLESYINDKLAPEDEKNREELEDILNEMTEKIKDSESDFYRVKRLVDTEFVGQLKREAKIIYLEYIKGNIDEQKHPEVIYLEDLIRRLREINNYLNDPDKADGYYEINYQGVQVNLREILSQSEAFDALPIIPIVAGNIGETTDKEKGKREFTFGLKLKLNGKVEARGGEKAFRYYLNLINPESEEHQKELKDEQKREKFIKKVFRIFCLYYFVFASLCEPEKPNYEIKSELEYKPVVSWETKFLPIFQGNDEEKKIKLLKTISDYFLGKENDAVKIKLKIESKIDKLVKLLRAFLNHSSWYKSGEYPRHILVSRVILEKDVNTILDKNTFFKPEVRENPKQSLQYISVKEAEVNSDALLALPAQIKIEDIRYIETGEKQVFSMGYNLQGIKVLPVLFVPKNDKARGEYGRNFQQSNLVLFPFALENGKLSSEKYFVYCFTFFFLVYISLKMLLDEGKPTLNPRQEGKQLFIPILRMHLKKRDKSEEKQDLDKQIAHYSKVLAHLLSEEYLSNSQGFNISDLNTYKSLNGMSSLYSVIPKKFKFANPKDTPKLEKLAIIIVSSRECDAKRGNPNRDERISNLLGEIVTVNMGENGVIDLRKWKSLTDNYPTKKMYKEPSVILDAVSNLYRREEYRHFLYIAQAPYTSTLNITQKIDPNQEKDELFFHSKNIISYLYEQHREIKLYPIFFDKYFVRKFKQTTQSLYIQDTKDLMELMQDESQQAVVFFNLFNGITVGKGDERSYNGVISYATLFNVYQEILNEKDLRQLIDDTGIKNDILQYLTLLHFSRYEKSTQISLKLDPYQHIIGDESVGKLGLFKHMGGKGEFNCLGFLTEVKKALIGGALRENR